MNPSFELPDVEQFGAVAVGPAGERVFYLQAKQGRQTVTLKVEKQHVAALAQHFATFLAELPGVDADVVPPPSAAITPIEPEWTAGNVALSYDQEADRIVVEIEELVGEEEESATVRLGISRPVATAFARDGAALVAAGRPSCPLCANPMDPEGHVCPRSNGQSRPSR